MAGHPSPIARKNLLWLGAALAGFGMLAFYKLGTAAMWLDELMALYFSDRTLADLVQSLRADVHAPLYYLALMGCVKSLGISEWTTRLPGVLFGAATVAALFFLALRLAGRRVAVFAALILALSPFFIENAREARPYSLSALMATLSWILFLRVLHGGRWRAAIGYGLACALLMLTFYLGIAIIASQVLLAAARPLAWRKRRRLLAAWTGSAGLFLLAWGPLLYTQLFARDAFRQNWLVARYPDGIRPQHVLSAVGEVYFGTLGRNLSPHLLWSLTAGVSLAGWWLIVRRNAAPTRRRGFPLARRIALWAFWGPLALYVAICLVKPIFWPRYLTMCAPFAALFLAAALARMPRKAGVLLLALMPLGALTSYRAYQASLPREDWRGAARAILAGIKPTDVIVTDNLNARPCLAYYCEWFGRPDLARNMFTFTQFYQQTRGRYPYADRTLWFVESKPQGQAQQRQLLHAVNVATGRTALEAGFVLETFHGMSGAP